MKQKVNRIVIDFIDHSAQRYPTVGDWYYVDDVLHIKVSRTPDDRHEQLVAVHELVEVLQCNNDNVTQADVDRWDMGEGADLEEPGDSPEAPYHAQHMIASAVERIMASALRVDWEEYANALEALEDEPTT